MRRQDRDDGFTLIELMVVVLVIAILLAIAIPTFLSARSRSAKAAAESNLRSTLSVAVASRSSDSTWPNATTLGAESGLRITDTYSSDRGEIAMQQFGSQLSLAARIDARTCARVVAGAGGQVQWSTTPLTTSNGCRGGPGLTVTTAAGTGVAGFADGPAASAQVNSASTLDIAADGTIYLADFLNDRIRALSTGGVMSTVAGTGTAGHADGPVASAQLHSPYFLDVAADGTIYFSEYSGNRVRKISGGIVSTIAGDTSSATPPAAYADGVGTAARFNGPSGIALGPDGFLYVADRQNCALRRIDLSTNAVTTLAGSPPPAAPVCAFADGTGSTARFNGTQSVFFAMDGTMIVADRWSNRIRRVTTAGVVTTIAGNGTVGSVDGPVATAVMGEPLEAIEGPDGAIWVGEHDGISGRIRRIDQFGVVTTIAGNSTAANIDGVGTAASFIDAHGLRFDAQGRLWIGQWTGGRLRLMS
jgi:prepilin-type N-terminal cleavage/methylation domain-containing protein